MPERDRILFVDDDPTMRVAFDQCLRGSPFHVDLAGSLADARALSAHHEYSVVVTDMGMPSGDGLDVIRMLSTRQPDAIFLMVTGATDFTLASDDADAAKITQILFKPFQKQELLRALERAIAAHRRSDATRRLADHDLHQEHPDHDVYRVLLVEDEKIDRTLIRRALGPALDHSFELEETERLSEAVQCLRRKAFDAVLCDLSLPDARGVTAITVLLAQTQAPIVVISGSDDARLSLQAILLGAQDFIVKSVDKDWAVAQRLRFAIERSRTLAHFEHMALHHTLTGLPNRTLFHDRLAEACKRARRGHALMGLLFVDLDGFKAVNDTFGHEAGDAVLRQTAQRLRVACREVDTAAHVGGDEFALVLDNICSLEDAVQVAERVVDSLAKPFTGIEGTPQISASVGVAWSDGDEDPEHLIRRADAAMYEAKRMGKNRVSIQDAESDVPWPRAGNE